MKYVILAVFSWKAFTICSVRNHLIETADEQMHVFNTFPVAAMRFSDLLVGCRMFTGVYLVCMLPQGSFYLEYF